MHTSAQGAIEYLLIIGAAILIVAIVITAITGVSSGGQTNTTTNQNTTTTALTEMQKLAHQCKYLGTGIKTITTEGTDQNVLCGKSGLMWTKIFPSLANQTDANTNCNNLTYAGFDDWRLPTCYSDTYGTGCEAYIYGMDMCDWNTTCGGEGALLIGGCARNSVLCPNIDFLDEGLSIRTWTSQISITPGAGTFMRPGGAISPNQTMTSNYRCVRQG